MPEYRIKAYQYGPGMPFSCELDSRLQKFISSSGPMVTKGSTFSHVAYEYIVLGLPHQWTMISIITVYCGCSVWRKFEGLP